MNDIIAAIATPAGVGAIGIVRLSGAGCIDLVSPLFRSVKGKHLTTYRARQMIYGHIVKDEHVYDEVMITYYRAPFSYTKEDIVEVFSHGSTVALREILQLFISSGARLATAGEFTKRAFLNGRIDLTQAEAVMDMISAKTKVGFDLAYDQLEGHLGQQLGAIIDQLTDIMAQIEVTIDYPDEDVEVIARQTVLEKLNGIVTQLETLSKSYEIGKIVRDGLAVAIVGRPNVGKSSLLNALLRENRAIVTDIAGTTRDVIEETINLNGIALRLIDTAGIRETDNAIEKIGVEKSKQHFNRADIVLLVLDGTQSLTAEDRAIIAAITDKMTIVAINKADLAQNIELAEIKQILPSASLVVTSALQRDGIIALEEQIEKLLIGDRLAAERQVISNIRHYEAIVKAKKHLAEALTALSVGQPLDIVDVDIADVYAAIGEITGHSVADDVIARIFEKFCLGK